MIRKLRNALAAFLRADPDLQAIRVRLDALEAAHDTLAQTVRESLDDRLDEGDKLYAKVRSALGRLYRLKGWEDADAAAAEPVEGQRPKLADVLSAKFKR